MLTQKQFISAIEEYPALASDENWRECLEDSFDELKSFSPEDLSILFALLDPALGEDIGEDFKEAIANHTLTLEEGVELANKMHFLEDNDEKEVAFIQKVYMDGGVTFEGVYEDVEDFGKRSASAFLDLRSLPEIGRYIDFESYGDSVLESDFDTHEYHGRLFVFRR